MALDPHVYRSVHFDEEDGQYLEATVTVKADGSVTQDEYDLTQALDCSRFGSLLLGVAIELLGPVAAADAALNTDFRLSIVPTSPD